MSESSGDGESSNVPKKRTRDSFRGIPFALRINNIVGNVIQFFRNLKRRAIEDRDFCLSNADLRRATENAANAIGCNERSIKKISQKIDSGAFKEKKNRNKLDASELSWTVSTAFESVSAFSNSMIVGYFQS